MGVIHQLGSAVTGFREGQRVAVNAITPCYRCDNCQRGYTSQCQGMLGGWEYANSKDGSLAEYFHVNTRPEGRKRTRPTSAWARRRPSRCASGGTISVIGYFGEGEYVRIPHVEWGGGISDKTIRTGLCPGGRERMTRLLRLLETGRVDPTPLTTHKFRFEEVEKALHLMATKEGGIIKPLILFEA